MSEKPTLDGGHLLFTQDGNSVHDGSIESLTVGVADAGGGKFFYIETDKRWSFDTVESLVQIINKAKIAFEVETK